MEQAKEEKEVNENAKVEDVVADDGVQDESEIIAEADEDYDVEFFKMHDLFGDVFGGGASGFDGLGGGFGALNDFGNMNAFDELGLNGSDNFFDTFLGDFMGDSGKEHYYEGPKKCHCYGPPCHAHDHHKKHCGGKKCHCYCPPKKCECKSHYCHCKKPEKTCHTCYEHPKVCVPKKCYCTDPEPPCKYKCHYPKERCYPSHYECPNEHTVNHEHQHRYGYHPEECDYLEKYKYCPEECEYMNKYRYYPEDCEYLHKCRKMVEVPMWPEAHDYHGYCNPHY